MPDADRLTAADIHNAAFAKPPMGRRGYREDQVDALLDALEAKFADPADPQLAWLTPDEVRRTTFNRPPIGQLGYHEGEVDELLARCADDLVLLSADTPVDHHRPHPPQTTDTGITGDDIRDVAFNRPPFGRRGYNEDQVDDFLDALEAKFADPADPSVAWLTPAAIAEATFGPPVFGKRGYHRDEVDRFLALCRTDLDDRLRPSR